MAQHAGPYEKKETLSTSPWMTSYIDFMRYCMAYKDKIFGREAVIPEVLESSIQRLRF